MLNEFRLALRRLVRAPGFTVVSIVIIGLVLGVNSAVLAIADAVLFRPLPYSRPEHLYLLRLVTIQTGKPVVLVADAHLQLAQTATSVEAIARRGTFGTVLEVGVDGVDTVGILTVSPTYFDVLGIHAARGRLFRDSDAGTPGGHVVLTYSSWRQRFGADEKIIGASRLVGGQQREVIGVLPRGFQLPAEGLTVSYGDAGRAAYEYVTVRSSQSLLPRSSAIDPIVRIKEGVSAAQAEAEIGAIFASSQTKPQVVPKLVDIRSVVFPLGQSVMRLVLAGAGLVLLLGFVNLAHLFWVRTNSRLQELGVRMVLGARHIESVRPIVYEALVIGVCGAMSALVFTQLAFDTIRGQIPASAYGEASIGVDKRIVIATIGLLGIYSVALAAVALSQVALTDFHGLIGGRRHVFKGRRPIIGQSSIVLQVALTVVLIAGAFAAANRLGTLLRVPLGFSPESVVVIGAVPTNLDGPALRAFYNQAVDELTAMENVEVASATDWMPLDSTRPRGETVVAANATPISVANVFHGYFETIAVSPVRGRTFSQNDTAPGSQVAVINESASKLLFAGTDPLGGTVRTTSNRIAEVIGVVPDVRMAIGQEPPPLVYLPPGAIFGRLTMLARLRSRAGAGPMELRRTVSGFDKGMPVTVSWWSSLIKSMAEFRAPRFQAFLLVSFSIIGILVTKLGIYAAISFAVAARSQELAIRAALGASEKSIAANVLWRALFPVSLGIILGVGLTWVIRNSVRAQMFGFEPEVSAGLFVAAAVILAVATLAAYAPARRAGRTDPIGALKLGRSGR